MQYQTNSVGFIDKDDRLSFDTTISVDGKVRVKGEIWESGALPEQIAGVALVVFDTETRMAMIYNSKSELIFGISIRPRSEA